MQAGKNQASQQPTAFGSMLQASTYGMVIPEIYGLVQSPLLAIWAANLRQGGSVKKFKQMKKGVTAYCENIDFLLGKNPILGVMQMWNNGSKLPLTFTKHQVSVSAPGPASVTVPDAHFYAVIGVTLTQNYSQAVNDYGGPGPDTLSGTFEVPLWNQLFAGSDPTDSHDFRNFPYCYRWEPSYGATIHIDQYPYGLLGSGTLTIYYAQLMDATSFQPPISRLRLSFESILGSGDEYDGFSTQQILYPWYAGLGSPDIDLGSAGAIPALKAEVQGKWGIYPSGDCDYVDIIEDICKSGIAQASIGGDLNFGALQHGVGCFDFPGCVQKKTMRSTTGADLPPIPFDMPNTPSSVLVVAATGSGPLSIRDTAGNSWTPILSGGFGRQAWHAKAVGGANEVTISSDGSIPPGLSNPVPPSAGQTVIWVRPASCTLVPKPNCSVAGDLTGGSVSCTGISGLLAKVIWDFATPSIPPGATVDAVYAVANVTAFRDTDVATFSDHLAGAIGLSVSSLPTTLGSSRMEMWMGASVPFTHPDGVWTVESPAIAVYVHGGTPPYSGPAEVLLLEAGGVDDVSAIESSAGTISSAGDPGRAAVLLAVPFYDSAAPVDAAIRWKHETAPNFYGETTQGFQAHSQLVKNPGAYDIAFPGSPATAALITLQATTPPTYPNPLPAFVDPATRELARAQCRAGGLWGSLSMNSQSAASDYISQLCEAANVAPVWSGFKLKLVPRSEVSAAGNGAIYIAPTASGPVADLDVDNGDFVASAGQPAIICARRARTDTDTVLQLQHLNRGSDYQQVVTSEPDPAGIALYGTRKKDPEQNNAIQDVSVARSLLRIKVRRRGYVEPLSYSFKLNARWSFLEAMDLVTITDRSQGIVRVPVRLTSTEEDERYENACGAEPFIYGIHSPQAITATAPSPYSGGAARDLTAGDVNPPIIFEPVKRLYNNGAQPQIWLVVSSPASNYGGCQVYVSTDLGASYNPVGDPLLGSAITGSVVADWPAAADPDTANDLQVDLTESNGTLDSYAVVDEDNFVYPCYVAGQQLVVQMNGTTIALLQNTVIKMNGTAIAESGSFGYELMTYASAVLTAAHKYTLKATGSGNKLRRDVFNAPTGTGDGVDHPATSRFAFLSPAGTGILKLNMDALWVGQTLLFKIVSFNEFGGAIQLLSDVPAYAYSPTGVPSSI